MCSLRNTLEEYQIGVIFFNFLKMLQLLGNKIKISHDIHDIFAKFIRRADAQFHIIMSVIEIWKRTKQMIKHVMSKAVEIKLEALWIPENQTKQKRDTLIDWS